MVNPNPGKAIARFHVMSKGRSNGLPIRLKVYLSHQQVNFHGQYKIVFAAMRANYLVLSMQINTSLYHS